MNTQVLKHVLWAMLTSDEFLGRLVDKIEPRYFGPPYAQTLAGWCLEHYRRYQKAPGDSIESIYHAEQPKYDADQMELVADLIDQIEAFDAENVNIDYLLDLTEQELRRTKLKEVSTQIEGLVERGDDEGLAEAESLLHGYDGATITKRQGFDPLFDDVETIRGDFQDDSEVVVRFPGAMGDFLNDQMIRGGFVSMLAPEKRGKSFMLIEIAYRALLQGKRVAYFEAGDHTQRQWKRRFRVRVAGIPSKARLCGDILVPTSIQCEGKGQYLIDHKVKRVEQPLDWQSSLKATEQFLRRIRCQSSNRLRVSAHPNSTLTVEDIKNQCAHWQRSEGFMPDLIVLDYADILAVPRSGQDDHRIKVGSVWKGLRAVSQELNALLLTATQSDARGYSQDTLNMSNFSEDKSKHAHVTGELGLNQTPEEKELGVLRLNWIAGREVEFQANQCVALAQQLSLGRAACCSCWA